MGKFLKSAGVALAAFGLAASAHAASYAEECDCSVWVPKHDGGFRFGIEGLYLAPSVSQTEFARTTNAAFTLQKTYNVGDDSDWGYALDAQYMWGGTGNDVKLAFTDVHMKNNSSLDLNNLAVGVTFDFGLPAATQPDYFPFPVNMKAAAVAAAPLANADILIGRYDVEEMLLDLEFGQAVATKNRVKMRFHGGLRYAQVDSKVSNALVDVATDIVLTLTNRSAFDGIGPRFGIDGDVELAYGFSVVTKFAAAVLVGDADVKNTAEVTTAGLQTFYGRHNVSYDDRVVLSHDARLGLRYDMQFDGGMELGLEGGYHTNNFTDVDYKAGTSATDIGTSGWYIRADLLI